MTKTKTVFGAFKTPDGASAAVDHLLAQNIPRDDIGLLMSKYAHKHFAALHKKSKASEGGSIGGAAGGVLGGLVAGLTAVGAISAPAIGLLAAGPLIAALAGSGAGAAAGGLLGSLIGLGMSEHEARRCKDMLEGEGVVVAVQATGDMIETAVKVLQDAGALEIDRTTGEFVQL